MSAPQASTGAGGGAPPATLTEARIAAAAAANACLEAEFPSGGGARRRRSARLARSLYSALMRAACADYLFHAATSPAFRDKAAALAARATALLQRFEARPLCNALGYAPPPLSCAYAAMPRAQGWPPGVGLEDEAEACDALTGAQQRTQV